MKTQKKISANDVLIWSDCKGETDKEKLEYLYSKIGKYFINNSKRMSEDFAPNTSNIKLTININWHEIITIDKQVKEYLLDTENL